MSYQDAIKDGIPVEKDSKNFKWYYPPCRICGAPVASWSYICGTQYVCQECRRELVILEHQTRLDADRDKKLKKLKTAIKRISDKTDIRPYKSAIEWVEKNLLEIDGKLFHGNDRAEKEYIRDEVIAGKFGDEWEVVHIDAENINMNITKLIPAIKAVLKERHKRKI